MIGHDGDRRVLAALAVHGYDLIKPAHTIHFLYFKTMAAANTAAGQIRAAGYNNVRVHPTPVKSIWKWLFGPREFSCIAETHAVPSEPAVFEATHQMNALAAKLGGAYAGWAASVQT